MRMDQQIGHPVLIEFWDFCRVNSIRTIPYMRAWYERYREAGLRVVGVHAAGFEPSSDPDAVRDAVVRLDVPYPVVVDVQLEIWEEYGNLGWPARYLFDGRSRLFEYHYGEGAYDETERAIQELLGLEREPLAPLRPEDAPGARLEPQTADRPGAYSGVYEAGGVWAVLDGAGTLRVRLTAADGTEELIAVEVSHPGAYVLAEHGRHTEGSIELDPAPGVLCLATCFTPGLSPG